MTLGDMLCSRCGRPLPEDQPPIRLLFGALICDDCDAKDRDREENE